jgi:hypothetical protein
LLRENNV